MNEYFARKFGQINVNQRLTTHNLNNFLNPQPASLFAYGFSSNQIENATKSDQVHKIKEEEVVFEYYSQENDSILIENSEEENSIFHNTFDKDNFPRDTNSKHKSNQINDTEEDEDEDEEIKLISCNKSFLDKIDGKLKEICIDLTKDDGDDDDDDYNEIAHKKPPTILTSKNPSLNLIDSNRAQTKAALEASSKAGEKISPIVINEKSKPFRFPFETKKSQNESPIVLTSKANTNQLKVDKQETPKRTNSTVVNKVHKIDDDHLLCYVLDDYERSVERTNKPAEIDLRDSPVSASSKPVKQNSLASAKRISKQLFASNPADEAEIDVDVPIIKLITSSSQNQSPKLKRLRDSSSSEDDTQEDESKNYFPKRNSSKSRKTYLSTSSEEDQEEVKERSKQAKEEKTTMDSKKSAYFEYLNSKNSSKPPPYQTPNKLTSTVNSDSDSNAVKESNGIAIKQTNIKSTNFAMETGSNVPKPDVNIQQSTTSSFKPTPNHPTLIRVNSNSLPPSPLSKQMSNNSSVLPKSPGGYLDSMKQGNSLKTVTGEVLGKQRATIQIDQPTGSPAHRKHKFPIPHVNNLNTSGETFAKRPNIAGESSHVAHSKPMQPNQNAISKQLSNIAINNENKGRAQQENKIQMERKRSEELDILNSIDATKKKIFDTLKSRHNLAHLPQSRMVKSAKANILQAATAKKLGKKQVKPVESLSLTQSLNIAKLEQLARIESIMAKKLADSNKTTSTPAVETSLPTVTIAEKPKTGKETELNQNDPNRVKQKMPTSNKPALNTEHQAEKDSKAQAKERTNSVTKCAKPVMENDILGKIMNDINKNASAPANTANQVAKKSEDENAYVIENFLYRILKCNHDWLYEQEKIGKPPPVIQDNEIVPIVDNYLSYSDYYNTMFHLLISETWEEISKAWREWSNAKVDKKTYNHMPIWLKSVGKIAKHAELVELVCQTVVETNSKAMPCEDDLLGLKLDIQNNSKNQLINLFGLVTKIVKLRKDENKIMDCVQNFIKENFKAKAQQAYSSCSPVKSAQTVNTNVYEFSIFVRFRRYITVPTQKIEYQVITSLASCMRRPKALVNCQRSALLKYILHGSAEDPIFRFEPNLVKKCGNQKEFKIPDANEYNESQHKVIMEASSIILHNEPKLCLIQGPPGTGKSHTIVGIINSMFARFSTMYQQHKTDASVKRPIIPKLLICSPSNGGCDELTRRLKAHRDHHKTKSFLSYSNKEFLIVRLGRTESMHRDCEQVYFDNLVKVKLDELIRKKELEKSSSLKSHYVELETKENILRKKIKALKASSSTNPTVVKECETQLEELVKKRKDFEMQMNKLNRNNANQLSQFDRKKLEQQAKEIVLREADIIICTLNFSGNQVLDCLTPEKNNNQSLINCIIIDEAAQCLEVECLIPLRFGCNRIIQVGDPEQLPATIFSKLAQDCKFNQSLFERFYQRFRFDERNPINMLYVQYRMHPEICAFPSDNFYKGKLRTHEDLKAKFAQSKLKPYFVYDIRESKEIGDETGGSIYNPKEAEVVLEHCKELTKKHPNHNIGIITPYQKQVQYLRELLNKSSLDKVECGTVDGYQGREKDIILFSTVRANNPSNTIGFVSNRQRMNVSLTRAKYALYIYCHAETLRTNSDWRECIENAKKRNLFSTK